MCWSELSCLHVAIPTLTIITVKEKNGKDEGSTQQTYKWVVSFATHSTIIKILLIKIATEYFISTHVTQSSFLSTLLVHLSEISETIIAQQSHALLCFCFTIISYLYYIYITFFYRCKNQLQYSRPALIK